MLKVDYFINEILMRKKHADKQEGIFYKKRKTVYTCDGT